MKRYIDEMQSRGREIENEVDSKNLFDSGITRAIKSARQSLGLDQDQEHKAIRKGLFRFSDALTQQYGDPRFTNRKGAVNNLASIAPAMAKGLEGYEDASDNIQHNNREVYEWAKKFRDSEIKRLRDQDKEAFDRYFADKKLGIELAKLDEQRDYHKAKTEKPSSNFGADFIPIEKTIESKPYKIAKSALGTSLSKIKDIKTQYEALRNKTKDNIADPMGAFSSITNPVKDVIGKFADSKVLRDETSDRKALASNLNEFIIQNENALRGGGVLGPKLIQVFKDLNIYPSLDRDTPEDFMKKLTRLEEETQKYYDTANYAVKYNIHLDPSEIDNFRTRYLNEEDEPALNNVTSETPMPSMISGTTTKNNSVVLYDPVTNEYFNVPESDLADIEQENPQLVRK